MYIYMRILRLGWINDGINGMDSRRVLTIGPISSFISYQAQGFGTDEIFFSRKNKGKEKTQYRS